MKTRLQAFQPVRVPSRGLIVVSWSEIDTIRQCPMKHQLSYVERWSKPPRPDGALAKGTLWHQVMEAHYRYLVSTQGARPGDPATESDADRLRGTVKAGEAVLIEAMKAADNPAAVDTVELVEWMYAGYVEMWGIDPDWWIAATEHAAQVRLPNLDGRLSRFALKLKIDLVVSTRIGLVGGGRGEWRNWVVDHKSGKDLPRDKDFDLMDQFKLYTWALHRVNRRVFGQLYNAARTYRTKEEKPLDTRFSRTLMAATDVELDRVAREAYETVARRYRQQLDLDRRGEDPDRHTNEQTCSWRCDLTEPCLNGRRGGDMRDHLYSSGFRQSFERH